MTTWSFKETASKVKIDITRSGMHICQHGEFVYESFDIDKPIDRHLLAAALKIIELAKERNPEMFKADLNVLTKAGSKHVYGR